ncbi:hypothetical protein TrispH2_003862 [Trichoplax sp. H2]|uniref:Uncharacterized protein n=1 Tax=Trichoplax adhaerens TaxID=10228 RepID=B3RVC3_TRIAD|nr:predicted protein [Trichoplax adhaerens]EDV25968.1 predicted protein [Trichoplax adhaerens]RDD44123.1 hypothetical protein TrispH2_003862 [Trichoplax sp. H2]|eukprot:XP_002112001.1 predicted protein [Trichoplax adhaerens]
MRQRRMMENKMCIVCNKEVPLGAISCSCGHVFITKRMLESGHIDWSEQFGVKRKRTHGEEGKLQDLDQNVFTDLRLMRIKRHKSKYGKGTTEDHRGRRKIRQISSNGMANKYTAKRNNTTIGSISPPTERLNKINHHPSHNLNCRGLKNSKSKQRLNGNRYKPKITQQFHHQINVTENLFKTAVADINRKITNQNLHDILLKSNRYQM